MTFAIVQTDNNEQFYLNHSCMSSLSFGSEDMAWTTEDAEKADCMLERCQRRHDDDTIKLEVI